MSGTAPVAQARAGSRLRGGLRRVALAVLICGLAASCRTAGSHAKPPPLDDEGELHVYLEPFERGSPHIEFILGAVSAVGTDGSVVQLAVGSRAVEASQHATHRLLAVGRVPPGSYAGLVLVTGSATLYRDGEPAALLVPPEGTRLDAPFTVSRARATLLSLSFDPVRSVDRGFAFAPAVSVAIPSPPVPGLTAICASTGADALTVLDKHSRRAVAVLPTGRDPMGALLDERTGQAFVVLSGEDRVLVLDVLSGSPVGSIPLRPGDRPREIARGNDERTLVVVNAGSDTVSFVDVVSSSEVGRVATGLEPVSIAIDRSRRRAYVLNRGSSSVTVLDLVSRAVAATIGTDAEPIRAAVNRAGTRLHLIHARSPYLVTLALPDLAPVARTFVGGGMSALAIDSRTDLLFVGREDDDRLQVLDSASLMPVRQLELPGAPADLALHEAENVIFAAIPGMRAVAATDLLTGRILSVVEVGERPFRIAVAGERR